MHNCSSTVQVYCTARALSYDNYKLAGCHVMYIYFRSSDGVNKASPLILYKIRNILSIRRTLDISSKNKCCNCNLYSGKYGNYYWIASAKLSETSAIYVTLFGDAFLDCGLSHHCNGVAMISVIDLGRNNTPVVRFSFAGFVHVSRSGARASVQRS